MAEDSSVKDIEKGLKKMLNIGQADSEQNVAKSSPSTSAKASGTASVSDKKKKAKKNKKGMTQESAVVNNSETKQQLSHHHQPSPCGQEVTQQVPQKKKRKRPKKKDATEKVVEKDMPETDSESDDITVAPQRKPNVPLYIKYLDDKLTLEILKELENERIFPLKKKSSKFIHAKYFCRLCDYHCDSVPICRQHYKDARHRRRKEIMVQDKKLKNLPCPSDRHAAALDDMVMKINHTHGLSEADIWQRENIVQELEQFLQISIPGASLYMYGSSLSSFGLKTSDLNIDLVLPGDMQLSQGLIAVYQLLLKADDYTEVRSDFHEKVPSVKFCCEGVCCQITIDNKDAYFTNLYLQIYCSLDPRMKQLAVVFKYWAKVCQVDQQEAGSLPAYTFILMTVYYLQQCKPPVLPVLWKDISEGALKGPKTTQVVLEALEELRDKGKSWRSANKESVGTLWRNMLVFYGVHFDLSEFIISVRQLAPLHRSDRKWKSKKVAVEDPFYCKRNVARSLYNNQIFDYFYNCLRKACLYFSLPTSHPDLSVYYKCKHKTSHKDKHEEHGHISHEHSLNNQGNESPVPSTDLTTEPSKNSAKLNKKDVYVHSDISETEQKCGGSCEKVEKGANCASEVVKKTKDLIADSVVTLCEDLEANQEVVKPTDIQVGFRASVKADAKPESSESAHTDKDSKEIDSIIAETEYSQETEKEKDFLSSSDTRSDFSIPLHDMVAEITTIDDSDDVTHKDDTNCLSSADTKTDTEGADKVPPPLDNDPPDKTDSRAVKGHLSRETLKKGKTSGSDSLGLEVGNAVDESNSSYCYTGSDADSDTSDSGPIHNRKKRVSSPVGATYDFNLTAMTQTDGKGPSIFCQLCDKEGHLKSNCPEDQLPPLQDLQPVTKQHLQYLTNTVNRVLRDFKLSNNEIDERERIRKDLEGFIQERFPDAELCLFGSSMNGFGFHQSDLDICVTFRKQKQEDLNFVEVIEAICKKLKTHRGLYNVFPITTAKVPIVKFKHRESQLEGDISLYNILAQHNTRLLYTYACIDPRVHTLGYAIKVFAKVCDIGDASKGSLSSYAYMLMMFHYLQHTKPPIIPVLQELVPEGAMKPQVMVDGCNAWFFDDLRQLPTIWPECGTNRQCVGELWLGFFRYYLEEFNLLEQVITIKQAAPLTKFEKLWNGKCVAIEDPFDLNHNLGGGLSRKMNKYILQSFIHARRLYGTPIQEVPAGFKTMEDYFFDNKQLTDGEPPSDRLCRVCSKIGHIAKECPRVSARKEREANERKRREEQRMTEDDRNKSSPNKNRPGYTRSLSESSDISSPGPSRSHKQQVYSRQTSDQQADYTRGYVEIQGTSGPRSRYPSTPPHSHHSHHSSQERHAHSQPPSPYNHHGQSYFTQGPAPRNWQSSPRSQQFRPNQNDNSQRRYTPSSPNNFSGPAGYYSEHSGSAAYGSSRGFSAKGNGDFYNAGYQNSSYIRTPPRDAHYQVPVLSYMNGIIPAFNISPVMPMQANVMAGFLPEANSMNPISAGQPVHYLTGSSPPGSGNITEQLAGVPVYYQGWLPPCPSFIFQPQHMDSQFVVGPQVELQGDAVGAERSVNIQKGARSSPNVGVTVKNDYYRGRDK